MFAPPQQSVLLEVLQVTLASLLIIVLILSTRRYHGRYTYDQPRGIQKIHIQPTVRVGGLGIFIALIFGYLIAPPHTKDILWLAIFGGAFFFLTGLLEDISKSTPVFFRLVLTFLWALVFNQVTGLSIKSVDFVPIDDFLKLEPIHVIFTAFAVTGLVNSFNIIDGLNGLSILTFFSAMAAFSSISFLSSDTQLFHAISVISAACFGFSIFNFPLGRIFLGDCGAYLCGFLVSVISILLVSRNPQVSPWCIIFVLSLPITETLFSIFRRLFIGASPGAADNMHLHGLLFAYVSSYRNIRVSSTALNAISAFLIVFPSFFVSVLSIFVYESKGWCIAGFILAVCIYILVYFSLSHKMNRLSHGL